MTLKKNNDKYIYLIKWDDKYKIGISKNPEQRLKQLSLGIKAKIIHKKLFPHPYKIEKYLHDYFKNKKYSNEWFILNEDNIEFIKEFDIDDYIESL